MFLVELDINSVHRVYTLSILLVIRIGLLCFLQEKESTLGYNTNGMYGHHLEQSMNQPSKVANPARGQLKREYENFPVRVGA